MPTSYEAVRVLLDFFVPGFLIQSVISLSGVCPQRSTQDSVLSTLAWSVLNYAMFYGVSIFYGLIVHAPLGPASLQQYSILQLLQLFLTPIVIGSIVLLARKWTFADKVKDLLGVFYRQSVTAWDELFLRGQDTFVLVTLTNDSKIGGYFGRKSCVSSYPASEDIFLQARWSVDENGKLGQQLPGSIWIKGNNIRHVEFFDYEISEVQKSE